MAHTTFWLTASHDDHGNGRVIRKGFVLKKDAEHSLAEVRARGHKQSYDSYSYTQVTLAGVLAKYNLRE